MTQVYNTLNQEEAGILSQLRTGHTLLNDSLARIGVENSAMCIYNSEIETVQHFLFYCPRWIDKRRSFRETMEERWRDLAYALEGWSRRINRGTGKLVDRPKEKWKPDIKVIKVVIQFVKATERFQPRTTIVERVEEAETIREESRGVSSSL
jgi:hypothetical protein